MGSSSVGEDAPVSFGMFSDMISRHDRMQKLLISLVCLLSFFFSFFFSFCPLVSCQNMLMCCSTYCQVLCAGSVLSRESTQLSAEVFTTGANTDITIQEV